MSAIFSDDRIYRYVLWREWQMNDGDERQGFGLERAYAMFVGLNPSTADEIKNDPTIRRCMSFAKSWGYGKLCMTNLFAFRSTKPEDMRKFVNPIGPDNDAWLEREAENAGVIIAAWGKHGSFLGRDRVVIKKFMKLKCLGINSDGSPRHPLYLRKDTMPVPFAA